MNVTTTVSAEVNLGEIYEICNAVYDYAYGTME